MKTPRTINIGDLLVEGGKQDTITMGPLMHSELLNLTKPGIDLYLHLVSLNDTQLLATIKSLTAHMDETCDYTGADFTRPISIEGEYMEFSLKPEGDQMPVSTMMTIDISEWIYQLIKLSEPLQKIHPDYVPQSIEDTESGEDGLIQGQIIFTK